jgi:hypothetical protein
MFGEDLGNGHTFVDQRPGIPGSFWDTQRPIPGKETAADGIHDEHAAEAAAALLEVAPGSMINLSIFPNLLIKGNQLEILTPRSVDRTDLHLWVCAAAEAPDVVNTLRMRIAEDFPTLGNPDDIEIYERCQRGLQIEEVEWCDTSKGIGFEDVEVREESEVRRSAVTYETPIRGYLREWKRLMASDPKIATV